MRLTAAAAVLSLGASAGLAGCSDAGSSAPGTAVGSTAPSAAAGSTPPAPPAPPTAAAVVPEQRPVRLPRLERRPSTAVRLDRGGAPAALVGTPGAVWVQAHRGTTLTRVDAGSGRVTASTDVGLLGCGDLLTAAGRVWLTGCEVTPGLAGVGEESAEVEATTYATGLGPAYLDGDLWVARTFSGATDLRRIDAAVVDEGEVVPVPGLLDGEGGVVVAGGSVWTVDKAGAVAYQVDPASDEVLAAVPMPVPPDSGYLVEHDGAPWYTDPSLGVLVRIDPVTGETRLSRVRTEKPTEYWGVAASTAPGPPGRMWVRSGDREVWLVDTRKDRVLRRVAVGDGGGGDVLQVGDVLWVAQFAEDRVERIPLT